MSLPSQDYTIGAIEVGVLISTLLYGVVVVQTYIYYFQRDHPDSLWIRLMVPLICLIDTISTPLSWHWLFRITVTYYGDLELAAQSGGHWSIAITGLFNGLVGAVVQSYFAYRIYAISRWRLIPLVAWVGSGCAFFAGLGVTVVSLPPFKSYDHYWVIILFLSLLLAVDLVTTAAMCYHLRIEKTGSVHADSIVNRVFLYIIQTGILTCLGAMLILIFALSLTNNTLWLGISMFYAKLYSNSFLLSINSRMSSRMGPQHQSRMTTTTTRTESTLNDTTHLGDPRHTHALDLEMATRSVLAKTSDDGHSLRKSIVPSTLSVD